MTYYDDEFEYEEDVYSAPYMEELVEDDAMDDFEQAFMRGYMEKDLEL